MNDATKKLDYKMLWEKLRAHLQDFSERGARANAEGWADEEADAARAVFELMQKMEHEQQ